LFGKDTPTNYVTKRFSYTGTIDCNIETLSVINYGKGNIELNFPTSVLPSGPEVFDIDEELNIYLFESPRLYKFSKDGKKIWEKEVDDTNSFDYKKRLLDFKYYKGNIYLYKWDKLEIYSANNFNYFKKIDLLHTETNAQAISNLSFFYDRYLFLQNFDFSKFAKKLKYIYDIEHEVFSSEIDDEIYFTPIINCEYCSLKIKKDLFDATKPIDYKGQSNRYLIFRYQCNPKTDPKLCKKYIRQYYLLNKKNGDTKMIDWGENYNGKEYGGGVDVTTRRPFVFINDTSFVCQSYYHEDRKPIKVIYFKMIFTENK
jgi:hypothetical protein